MIDAMGDLAHYGPGQKLPGTVYRVIRHLATGGMGSVYDVEDVSVGKRYVLKTLHPQLIARQDLAKRMEAEARTLGKLQHPNIVDVVTAGVTTDEWRMPFYVMERLNGQNLRVVLEKKGALELAHCYRIAIDVLDALEHAHENSVIHRDVKPENIFLHRNVNGTTITKLLDFGIVRMLDRKASHTQGKFIGTLRYASPEQITGGELGPGTDIYSLGLVLYEMLAGVGPFDDVGDAYAIGAAHAQKAPPPLSRFVTVPRELERLVMSSIAKTAAERPRDAFSFAGELRRMLRDEEAAPRAATPVPPYARPEDGAETAPELPASGHAAGVALATTVASDPMSVPPRVQAGPGFTRRLPVSGQSVAAEGGGAGAVGSDDIVFPPTSQVPAGTGPIAGEASTRPPDKRGLAPVMLPALVALAVGVFVIGVAALAVTKPWARASASGVAPAASPAPPVAPGSATATVAVTAAVTAPAPVTATAAAPALTTSHTVAAPRSPAGRPAGGGAPAAPAVPAKKPPKTPGPGAPAPPGPGAPAPAEVGFD